MTPTPPRPRTRRKRLIIGLSAAVTVILLGAAVAAAWLFGDTLADAKPAANALSAETQAECISIRREFQAWDKDVTRLDSMVKSGTSNTDRAVTRFELDQLKKAGDAFAKATTGYPDKAAKELAVAVASYNVELGMVSLEHQLTGGTFKKEQHQKAVDAAVAVEKAYKTFSTQTCGTSF